MSRKTAQLPIILAAEIGDIDTLRAILDRDAEQIHTKCKLGNTALHVAAFQNQIQVVETLLNHGATLNLPGNKGMTPLHFAAAGGAIDVAQLLLKNGADLTIRDDHSRTPLQVAAEGVRPGLPKTQRLFDLLQRQSAHHDLPTAVIRNDVAQVEQIFEKDSAALSRIPQAGDLLYLAVLKEVHPTIIRLLLEHGAKPNVAPRGTDPPITLAADPATADVLLEYGANPNVRDHLGRTPLQKARKYRMKELEEVLLRYGARLRGGVTPPVKKSARNQTPNKRSKRDSSASSEEGSSGKP